MKSGLYFGRFGQPDDQELVAAKQQVERLRAALERLLGAEDMLAMPCEFTEESFRLVRAALADVPQADDRREQAISFAYGNVKLHNPAITREMVAEQYDGLHPAPEPVETRTEWRAAWEQEQVGTDALEPQYDELRRGWPLTEYDELDRLRKLVSRFSRFPSLHNVRLESRTISATPWEREKS